MTKNAGFLLSQSLEKKTRQRQLISCKAYEVQRHPIIFFVCKFSFFLSQDFNQETWLPLQTYTLYIQLPCLNKVWNLINFLNNVWTRMGNKYDFKYRQKCDSFEVKACKQIPRWTRPHDIGGECTFYSIFILNNLKISISYLSNLKLNSYRIPTKEGT